MEEEESGKGNGAGATWQKDVEMDMAAAMVTGSSMDDDKVEGEREGEGDGEGEVGEGGEGGEEEEEEGKERMRSFVEEADEMKKLISAISRADGAADPAIYKRMENILEKYQEQPQLLDPHLEAITVPTMAALDRRVMNGIAAGDVGDAESVDLSAVKKLCRLMRVLAKVRGYKTVVKFFPNHARQLEPVLALLQRCHKLWRARSELEDGEMETLCTLLLWLSILALIPFDLATVDTALANKLYDNGCGKEVANGEWGVEGKNQPPPLVDRMVAIAKHYLGCQGVMRDMAAVLLSRLLTRPDMKVALKSFVAWAHAIIVAVQGDDPSDPSSVLSVVGVVNAMVHIFKVGGRDILATVAEQCWSDACTLAASPMAQCSSLTMKLLMKLAERISLTYLPPKIPTWRYKRCERSLSRTLGSIGCGEFPHSPAIQSDVAARVEREKADVGWRPPSLKTGGMNGVSGGGLALAGGTIDNGEERGGEDEGNDGNDMDDDANDDEDEDIPEVIEDVIEQLLAGLRNKQGDVRWSAAKGIGRVTGRLPLSLADDVVASVLELFKPTEGDGAWHGGCLALAELARRGLLLPGRLETVVPVVEKALHYDVRRGAHSIGGHVRDAAAYVCWAFVRAYSPDIMLKPLTRLAPVLLTVAVYDREVNCRRAAAAAFQESVGRQGNFLHGIDLVNVADYFSLGMRSHAYREVAVQVAKFEEYRYALIDHLLKSKIRHWDASIRELAAESLGLLAAHSADYFVDRVIDELVPWTLSPDLLLRHGAVLAIASVVAILRKHGIDLPEEKQAEVGEVVPAIEKARLYRGKGGELMRSAVCRLIESIAFAKMSLASRIRKCLHDTINDNLKHPNAKIQSQAVRALRVFARTYLLPASANRIELSTAKYLSTLRTDRNPASRRGSALALGELPSELLQPMKEEVIDALCNATVAIEDNPEHCDVESRVNAVSSLIAVCETLGIREEKHVDRNGNGDGDGDGDGEGDGDGDGTVATCEENGGEDSVCGVNGDGVGRRRNSEKKDHDEGHLPVGIVGRRVVDCLLASLDDYAIDKRGDVGSWVRKAAMNALERCAWLLSKFLEKDEKRKGGDAEKEGYREKRVRSEFASDLALRVMGGVMKQAVEKIDSVRDVAGRMLHRLVHTRQLAVLNWPRHRELQAIIPSNQAINWKAASQSFPILVKILAFPEYRPFIVSGLVISVGGLGNSLGQSSSSSLSSFLLDHMTSEDARSLAFVRDFANEFIVLMRTNLHSDRVIIPTMKALDILLTDGVFEPLQPPEEQFALEALECVKLEIRGCRDIPKLMAAVNLACHFAPMPEPARSLAMFQLLTLLCNCFPKIRKYTAEQLYLHLLTRCDDDEQEAEEEEEEDGEEGEERQDCLDEVFEILTETRWDSPVAEIRKDRDKLFDLLKVPKLPTKASAHRSSAVASCSATVL